MTRRLAIVLTALILILVLIGLINDNVDKRCEVITYSVGSGDTLDGIYYEHNVGDIPLKKWRYDVKKLNGKKTSDLEVGEQLKIYVEKDGEKNAD